MGRGKQKEKFRPHENFHCCPHCKSYHFLDTYFYDEAAENEGRSRANCQHCKISLYIDTVNKDGMVMIMHVMTHVQAGDNRKSDPKVWSGIANKNLSLKRKRFQLVT